MGEEIGPWADRVVGFAHVLHVVWVRRRRDGILLRKGKGCGFEGGTMAITRRTRLQRSVRRTMYR